MPLVGLEDPVTIHSGQKNAVFWSGMNDFLVTGARSNAAVLPVQCVTCGTSMKRGERGRIPAAVCPQHGIWFPMNSFVLILERFSKSMTLVAREIQKRNEEIENRRRQRRDFT